MGEKILGRHVYRTLREKVQPEHTALLIVDVQNDAFSPKGALAQSGVQIDSFEEVLRRIHQLIEGAHIVGGSVVNLQMTMHEDGRKSSAVDLARRLNVWNDELMVTIEGTWGHAPPESLKFSGEDLNLQKYRNNAFVGTRLDELLRERGTETVIVCGFATHACVLETALMAQSLDYYVVIPTDCVGSSQDDLHIAGLRVLEAVLHDEGLTTAPAILEIWREGG